MSRRSSLLVALGVAGCMPPYDPLLICHNANCAATGNYADDTLPALRESLALEYEGRPMFDGVELDTYLYYNGGDPVCLFAHDDLNPEESAAPSEAAALVAEHLQKDIAAWNGERFYLKVELKPTVAGTDFFHTGPQLQQHAECALELVERAVTGSRHPVTVIFDSNAECLHAEIVDRMKYDRWIALVSDPDLELLFSGPVVTKRPCIPVPLDIRTFFVRDWRDTELEAIRPVMVWLDQRSENTESLKIIRHLRPEYVTTSAAPFVRGWIEGYQ